MARNPVFAVKPVIGGGRGQPRPRYGFGAALGLALVLAGCAVEVQNTQPAREVAQLAKPAGSTYAGWRIFQDKCVACHGAEATGTDRGPNLLSRIGDMGSRRFVNLVLRRYDWSFQAAEAGREGAAREALVEDVLRRQQGSLSMPAWQDEPSVNAHILDLYAYLTARSDGTLRPGRPAP